MKFSALVLVMVAGCASGFTPSPAAGARGHLHAATLENVKTETTVESKTSVKEGAVAMGGPIEAGMDVSMPMSTAANDKCIQPGRYSTKENSVAIPFLKRPAKLDGTHAGDYGFDPLGFTEDYDLYTMQEAELRHARLAMLAVVGWPLSELVAPDWMLQNGCAPSVLNGFNPLSFLATAAAFGAMGFFEYKTALRRVDNTKLGKIHEEDMSQVWKWGVVGDYNFDPLNLYSSLGDDAYSRKGLRELEISHGRSAMLGITAFAGWEALTGHPIVENSMFFHPNALLPALYLSYVAFGQFYELEESEMFYRFKMSSEGEARWENLKMQFNDKNSSNDGEDTTQQVLSSLGDAISKAAQSVPGKYEQLKDAYMKNVVNWDQ